MYDVTISVRPKDTWEKKKATLHLRLHLRLSL